MSRSTMAAEQAAAVACFCFEGTPDLPHGKAGQTATGKILKRELAKNSKITELPS
jgi:hypothetical protein